MATGTAVWYHSGKPPAPILWVLIRDPLGEFDPQALFCTDQRAAPEKIVGWFIRRWSMEVTFHEVRSHLGFESQRQWSDKAIERTSPAILALFSLVTVFAHKTIEKERTIPVRSTAWYTKQIPTFIDALAIVRRELWPKTFFDTSIATEDMQKIPRELFNRMVETLAYAA